MSDETIVVVDGNEKVRKLVSTLLVKQGHQVLQGEHGVDVARNLRGVTPSLILVDQDVPAGGLRTARILRLNPKYHAVPLLLTISLRKDGAKEFIREALEAGITGFLGKPYTSRVLLGKVKELLVEQDRTVTSVETIKREIRSLSDLPTMSPTRQKILSLLAHEDSEVNVDELVRTTESDQGLTARILKIGNSAYYGFQGKLIRSAITFLGMQNIRKIVQSATVLNVFEQEGGGTGMFDRIELWKHAVACGIVIQMLSHQIRGSGHFLAGLLHDVGKIVLDYQFTEYFQQIVDMVHQEGMTMYQAERELLGISHAEIGQELCHVWGLPPEIGICVANHHDPAQAPMHQRLASLMHLSNIAVRTMEIGYGGDPHIPEVNPYAGRLRVNLDAVYEKKEEIVEQVESIVSPT